jgi:DNA replication licensing factor MCM4
MYQEIFNCTLFYVKGYLSMRAMGGRGSKTISATPRQLESLIRISQALAKMRLSDIVLRSDVDEAIRLMRVATQTAATDPRTGTIDMDMIATGK